MKVVKQTSCVAHWIGGLLGWVLESSTLLYAVVCPSEGTQNSRCLSKARPMTATERGKDSSIYISTEYEGFVKHLLCVSHWSGGLLGWVYSLNHFTMLWFAPLEVPRILDNFQKLGQWQQQYVNMIHPYAHPQHMKAVKHLICVWHWSESPLGWVYPQPLCYSLVCPSWGTQNFQKLHHINESSGIMAKTHPYAHATAYEGCMTTCMLLIWSRRSFEWLSRINHCTTLWFAPLEVYPKL